MLKRLFSVIAKNPTAQALLMAAPASAAVYLVKDLPVRGWDLAVKHSTVTLRFDSSMDYYKNILTMAQSYLWKSRVFTVDESMSMKMGYGFHYGKFKGTFFKMYRGDADKSTSDWFRESVEVTFFTRKDSIIQDFLDEAAKTVDRERLSIYANTSNYWDTAGKLSPRSLDTVIYSRKSEVISAIDKFYASEEEYISKGNPYHMGILLTGEPGTGKTSIINGIANHLNKSIYYLDPSKMEKGSLARLLSSVDWRKGILVIEDIDVSGAPTNRDKSDGMPLSEMLNSLDGLMTPHGMVTIATTNHIEELDPALVRPGRFDYVMEVGRMDRNEAQELASKFGKTIPDNYEPMTGAELREMFMKC